MLYCPLHLDLPNDKWWWTFSYVSVGHLLVFMKCLFIYFSFWWDFNIFELFPTSFKSLTTQIFFCFCFVLIKSSLIGTTQLLSTSVATGCPHSSSNIVEIPLNWQLENQCIFLFRKNLQKSWGADEKCLFQSKAGPSRNGWLRNGVLWKSSLDCILLSPCFLASAVLSISKFFQKHLQGRKSKATSFVILPVKQAWVGKGEMVCQHAKSMKNCCT